MPTLRTVRARVRLANPQAPAPVPTQLIWYPPTTAALRPVSQVGRGLHRATDTGDVTLWDGGAWRDVGEAAEGLPEGGDAADLLTGDGEWTPRGTVLHDALAAVNGATEGAAIVGTGDGERSSPRARPSRPSSPRATPPR